MLTLKVIAVGKPKKNLSGKGKGNCCGKTEKNLSGR